MLSLLPRLVFLLVLLTSVFSISTQAPRAHASGVENPIQAKASAAIAFKREYLSDVIDQVENQVRSLANNPFTLAYASRFTKLERTHLAQLFLTISAANAQYVQVRFLDARGQERVRIDRPRDGSGPRAIPDKALQVRNC